MVNNAHTTPATKQDLVDLKHEIVTEISNVIADAMTSIGMNFERLSSDNQELKNDVRHIKKDIIQLKNGQTRIENKLNPTIDRVDDLTIRVARLERRAA